MKSSWTTNCSFQPTTITWPTLVRIMHIFCIAMKESRTTNCSSQWRGHEQPTVTFSPSQLHDQSGLGSCIYFLCAMKSSWTTNCSFQPTTITWPIMVRIMHIFVCAMKRSWITHCSFQPTTFTWPTRVRIMHIYILYVPWRGHERPTVAFSPPQLHDQPGLELFIYFVCAMESTWTTNRSF